MSMSRPLCPLPAFAFVFGFLLTTLSLSAQEAAAPAGEGEPGRVAKHRIVVVDDDGKVSGGEGVSADEPDGAPWKIAGFLGRGFLGVEVTDLSAELRRHFGAGDEHGVLVARVSPGSPAEAAGIEVGDVLVAVGGEPVSSRMGLVAAVRRKDAGTTVDVELVRAGRTQTVSAEIAERERQSVHFRALRPRDGEAFRFIGPGEFELLPPEQMGAAMARLRERLDSGEFEEKLDRLRSIDWSSVESKMKALEERVRTLERELAAREGGVQPN